ncbi:proline-rich receptor protein kinase PERK1 [Spatholobus suberectus]|nr:proline-rich receptor protein kinase PERK1 [Spatholobus suberectus]
MPRKKQQCGFRIPWISGPSNESHSPKQKSKSPATHRPPFRPPGVASPPPPHGTPKTEPKQVSNSLPSHSPAPSVIIDSPVSSLSEPSRAEENIRLHSEPNVKELELESTTPTENSNSNAPLETRSKPHQSKSNANAVERKMMFATSTPSGKDIKVVTPASTSATITLSNEENPTKDDISALNPTLSVDDKTVSVVTLAGDNRGVTMRVAGSHPTRPKPEGRSASNEKDEAGRTYVNSNIQSINNSIMSHGSINGRDPGVRVVLPEQPQPDVKQPCLDKPKAEVSIKRAERVPYQAVVRRRCLRGLFLEPSDSDPDNPDKPRRHGCKFGCGEDKEIVTK